MAGLFQTLLRPDREEDSERAEVAKAANLLQIGEFQLLQLAYRAWHGEEMPEAASDTIFRSYMVLSRVPAWARHYARRVIELDEAGELDDSDPRYHRYDSDYFKAMPLGARRLVLALCCIGFVMGGGLFVGYLAPVKVTSILPPYFSEQELAPNANDAVRGP
ncbi:MAG: hypothetical protein IIC53_00220 [Proteobacteria bacterium]|nr:hypothetical protein [Pseudomonadota bacterium]